MRIRFFLALASVTFVMACFAVQACDSTIETAGPKEDASVAETAPAETGTADAATELDAADAAIACDPMKDFLSDIPDASIADGASTTGACVACAKASCAPELMKCGADCACQGVASKGLACYVAMPDDVLACASQFLAVPMATRTIGIALFACIQQGCDNACAASAFLGDGGDGGDGGD